MAAHGRNGKAGALELQALLAEHPGLLTCRVVQRFGAPDEGSIYDVYFVPEPDKQIAVEGLNAYLRRHDIGAPDICFIDVSALVTRVGRSGAAVDVDRVLTNDGLDASDATNLERLLAVFLTATLDRDSLTRSDDLLTVGVAPHARGLVARIEGAFQFDVPTHIIFDHPTISDIARVLSSVASTRDLEADAALVISALREWRHRVEMHAMPNAAVARPLESPSRSKART